ncbi:pyridoxamine 5'-phosphate oxidase family protein [Streptomyces sp. PU10]|uniref:pyridoxamine 5'-phosphate oxidase family protein n=1 Tax=Streptomyces TaxID=1883 RepID=UPI00106E8D73|nr:MULTISPECIES: pyridoxamine 5'-phosphate oxidase family protein [unclassified Streptomyces]MDU0255228.1 pyridoxamine 5'-phosphate oxidase family protein [Streptomyces sp. PU10]QKW62047.1 pyridoxamine 5'-phosphate oxidase family protein [Streptomyces sp. NA03103]WSU02326.1 pyridoxamine 5'-phosphate oxidase family protein [Streptomyces sp. NBC_01124]
MSTVPLRMSEVSGPEALWLLKGSSLGRLVYVQRGLTVIRPARHVWGVGRLIIRTPAQAVAVPATATYHVDDVHAASGTGWSVTANGPTEVINDPDETAHYRRTLSGWSHGPHDTIVRIRPQTVTGFRLAPAGS